MKISKSNEFCSVYGCNSRRKKNPNISFHCFPQEGKFKAKERNFFGEVEEIDLRQLWILKLKIGKEVTKHMRVCSRHFTESNFFFPGLESKRRRLKSNAVPSQNLPKVFPRASCIKSPSKAQACAAARISRLAKRTLLRKSAIENHTHDEEDSYNKEELDAAYALMNMSNPEAEKHTFEERQNEVVKNTCDDNAVISLVVTSCDIGIQVKSGDIVVPFVATITSEKVLNIFTGLPSFSHLDFLCEEVKILLLDKRVHKLSVRERVILTLMKLKQNFTFSVLSVLFNTITATTCRRIFIETIECLAAVLKNLVQRWPDKAEIGSNMPKCFSEFKDVVSVLDCTEISVQTPKCALCKLKLYSHYKSCLTIKFMTAVTPAGLICFVSEAYGGRASDKVICEQSKVLDYFSKGEAVMVDKGFLIDDICQKRGVKIVRPPFLRNKTQFSHTDALLNRKIASARVHIERSNQRLKNFQILRQKYPTSLLNVVNEIFLVICGITNMSSAILSDDKF